MGEQEILAAAKKAILDYDVEKAKQVAKEGLDAGVDPVALVEKGFVPGIQEIGDLFDCGDVYLPELILAADAMKAGTEICEAAFPETASKTKKKVIMATVEGDIHDIGKSIVVSFLSANGFDVYNLGRDVTVDTFVAKTKEIQPDVIGSSALLTTTMGHQEELEKALREAGIRDKVKTIVGGAPTSQEWADKIGADAYAENAAEAVAKVKKLCGVS